MFKKLDLYIIKKYLSTFFFVVTALVAVICFIDFAEKNDDFQDANLSYMVVFLEYYLNYIPYLAIFLSPLMVFVSTIIVTSQMASHTEVIAILSSRISYVRMMGSFAKGAVMLALFVFVMIGWVLPKTNKKKVDFEIEYINSQYNYKVRDTHLKLDPTHYAYIEKYNSEFNIGYQFTIEEMIDGVLISKLSTNRIGWDTAKSKWHLELASLREYHDGKETLKQIAAFDTTLNMFPKDFQSTYRKQETLTIPELHSFIEVQRERGADNVSMYVTELMERYTYPFSIILLTLVAITVASKKSREGTGLKIFLGFILAFVYLFFVIVGRGFIESDLLPPLLSAWIPNLLFGSIGVYLYIKAPK